MRMISKVCSMLSRKWKPLAICILVVCAVFLYSNENENREMQTAKNDDVLRHVAQRLTTLRQSADIRKNRTFHLDNIGAQDGFSRKRRKRLGKRKQKNQSVKRFATPVRYNVELPNVINCTTGRKDFPKSLIIGAAKCGTSALLNFLSQHPNVTDTDPYYESNFFGKGFFKGLNWYRNILPCAKKGEITIMKSPQYLYNAKAAERIYDFDKDMKLIVITCNPVKRVISKLSALNAHGVINQTLESSVIDEVTKKVRVNHSIVQGSYYAKLIKKYLDIFNRSQLYFVDGDNLVAAPVEELIKLEKFLDIDPWFGGQTLRKNERNAVFMCMNNNCLNERKGREHIHASDDVIDKLLEFYKPLNKEFFEMIDITYNWNTRSYW